MTRRITELVKRIPRVETLIDVGCDHGKIGYYALKTGKIKSLISTDISAPSLEKARGLISAEYPETQFIVADGVPKECAPDFAVIAGMGGEEIIKILKNTDKVSAGLFQPMNNLPFVRRELVKMGYRILTDEIFIDDKFYNVITVEKGDDGLSEEEIFFGRTNLIAPTADFEKYLDFEEKKVESILQGIEDINPRHQELTHYLTLLRKIK